jgi:hypothetical protein
MLRVVRVCCVWGKMRIYEALQVLVCPQSSFGATPTELGH